MFHILVVEDEESHAELLLRAFLHTSDRFSLTVVSNLEEARESLKTGYPDLVISDLLLPDGQGTDLLPGNGNPPFPLVVMTSYGDEHIAVGAIKAGAIEYVVKSVMTFNEMPRIAERAMQEWERISERWHVEEDLHKNAEFVNSILENIPDMIFVKEANNLRFVKFNKAGEQLLGYSRDDLIGKNDFDFFREEEAAFFTSKDMEVLRSPRLLDIPEEIIHTRFGDRILHTKKIPILDESGHPRYLLGISEDITERKQIEDELKKVNAIHSLILDNSTVGIAFVRNRRFEWVNLKAAQMLGRSPEQIQGSITRILYATDDEFEKTGRDAYSYLAMGERFETEIHAQRADGTIYWARLLGKALDPANTQNGSIWIIEDIDQRKRDEEQLRSLNRQLEIIIEFLPDATFIIDKDKRIMAWNRSMEELTGVQKSEIIGKDHLFSAVPFYGSPRPYLIDLIDLIGVDDKELASKYASVQRKGNSLLAEVFTPALNGGKGAYVWAIAAPLFDNDGTLIGAIESIRDISDRKKAEDEQRESQQRYRQLFESSPVSLWEDDFSDVKFYLDDLSSRGIKDLRTYFRDHPEDIMDCIRRIKILNVNQSTLTLFGAQTKEELISRFLDLFTEETYPIFREEIIALAEGKELFESELVRKSLTGEKRLLLLRMTVPKEYKDTLGRVLISLVDISDRKHAEDELKAHQEHLEELVEQRTAQLREAMEQAEAATRAKSTFIANMSHELRTPLNAVIGYAQLMTHGAHDQETSLHLDRILRSSEHLLGLINDVLSISRIEAGRLVLNLEAFSTDSFFQDIENMIRLRAQFKGLSFHIDIAPSMPPAVLGDAQKLRQVLVNLLGNAVKFTENGTVSLLVNRNMDRTRFQILDTGTGIETDSQEKIFNPFEQLGITRSHSEGTGLGLQISQAIVQLMGGKIEVRSEPEKGSSFHFEIPLPEVGTDAIPRPLHRILGLTKGQFLPKQLVVDDVEDSRCLLRDIFEKIGLEVTIACNGLEALISWETAEPRVVWMDLLMPEMDGWHAARAIRAREKQLDRGHTILIALTASVINLNVDDLTDAGFDDWILKPFQESTLLQKLETHLGLKFETTGETAEILKEVEPSSLNSVDPGWFQSFRRSLVLGDTTEMLVLIDQLQDPDLARGMRSHVSEYRYEKLKELLDKGEQRA